MKKTPSSLCASTAAVGHRGASRCRRQYDSLLVAVMEMVMCAVREDGRDGGLCACPSSLDTSPPPCVPNCHINTHRERARQPVARSPRHTTSPPGRPRPRPPTSAPSLPALCAIRRRGTGVMRGRGPCDTAWRRTAHRAGCTRAEHSSPRGRGTRTHTRTEHRAQSTVPRVCVGACGHYGCVGVTPPAHLGCHAVPSHRAMMGGISITSHSTLRGVCIVGARCVHTSSAMQEYSNVVL